jgi:hypothetical protein
MLDCVEIFIYNENKKKQIHHIKDLNQSIDQIFHFSVV